MVWRSLATIAVLAVAGCGSVTEGESQGSVTLCLPAGERAVPLEAELAVTPDERQAGLSERSELARRSGMLFVYPREEGPDNSFWMYRTRIPLTILFLDGDGVVRSIKDMDPCLENTGSECDSHPAGVDHWMALEVNQGLPDALGITEGDTILRSPNGEQASCEATRALSREGLPEAY
ncbi:MAG: DUF192 domain-containing protein [Pseudomonadota bacterium]